MKLDLIWHNFCFTLSMQLELSRIIPVKLTPDLLGSGFSKLLASKTKENPQNMNDVKDPINSNDFLSMIYGKLVALKIIKQGAPMNDLIKKSKTLHKVASASKEISSHESKSLGKLIEKELLSAKKNKNIINNSIKPIALENAPSLNGVIQYEMLAEMDQSKTPKSTGAQGKIEFGQSNLEFSKFTWADKEIHNAKVEKDSIGSGSRGGILAYGAHWSDGKNKNIKLMLEPKHLGNVEVSLAIKESSNQKNYIKALIMASNQETLDILKNDSKTLDMNLQNSGFSSQLDFSQNGHKNYVAQQYENSKRGKSIFEFIVKEKLDVRV